MGGFNGAWLDRYGIRPAYLGLALGVRPFWVWKSVLRGRSHFSDPLLTLTLIVLRCLQTQWLVTGVGLGHKH